MNINRIIEEDYVLQDIYTLLTYRIQWIRELERVDEAAVESFRQDLKNGISNIRRAIAFAMHQMLQPAQFSKFIYQRMNNLLLIAGDLHGQVPVEDLYVLPDRLDHRFYHYAWQELVKLTNEIQVTYQDDLSYPIYLPSGYLANVRYEFCQDLLPVADDFCSNGVCENLVKTLMHPFREFQSSESDDLIHRELVNLRKLKAAILECRNKPGVDLSDALYHVLYRFDVNTLETVQYCKEHLHAALERVDRTADKREVLARYERSLRQTTIELTISFAPWLDSLVDQMLKVIEAENTYWSGKPWPDASTDMGTMLKLKITNEHYAAQMRVLQENGFYDESQSDVIHVTGQLFKSNKDKDIGMSAYKQNFKDPTLKAKQDTWNRELQQLCWMMDNWGDDGIPDLRNMTQQDLDKFILMLKTLFPPKKSGS